MSSFSASGNLPCLTPPASANSAKRSSSSLPYKAQVFEIQRRLPGVLVGTVDKYQGQEAPIAIYSTATSSRADAPRGMEFLYSGNRLNVATSRAKCVCIMVGSPELLEAECRTPRQARLANAFCRFLELAHPVVFSAGRPQQSALSVRLPARSFLPLNQQVVIHTRK
jgi:hypothetical protein